MKIKKRQNFRTPLKNKSADDPLMIYLKDDARKLLIAVSRKCDLSPSDAGELILSSVLVVAKRLRELQSTPKYHNRSVPLNLNEAQTSEGSNRENIVRQLIGRLNKNCVQWNDVMNLFKTHQITPSEFQEFMNHALSVAHFRLAETACLFQLYDSESQNRFFSQLRYLRMKGVLTAH